MIKIENVETCGWEAAIRGMRNPKNSWVKSDSHKCPCADWDGDCPMVMNENEPAKDCNPDKYRFCVGENDFHLMQVLANSGPDDGKFLRMIHVQLDVTAPLYWWSEADTYKVGTVANSCSKMHKLLHKPFEMSDFSFDKLPGYKNEVKQFRPDFDEESEEWRAINDEYEVSSAGRVRHGERVLSGSVHADGYIFVTLGGSQLRVHRLVAKAFVPNPTGKPEVNHIDGNRMNNAAGNLEWTTRSENQKHAVDNGLQPRVTDTYQGRFTPEQREEIKRLWDSGTVSKRQIARQYGVSHTCICDIINDKYRYAAYVNVFESVARPLVDTLNELRDAYFTCDDTTVRKKIWYTILQLLPSSYNQRRTWDLNYAVLRNIYHARRNHKLDEWRELCAWIKTLPYSELITGKGEPTGD